FTSPPNSAATEIGITFPQWRGSNTVLEARREFRVLRQPLIVKVTMTGKTSMLIRHPAQRAPSTQSDMSPALVEPFKPDAISLDGEWELAWCEKGAGPPTNGWRKVQVPGSAHTQWLDPSKIYSRQAEWLSYKEWWYRRTFQLPARFANNRLLLEFEATDYYADTWLNGDFLG